MDLKQKQALPFERKVLIAQTKIIEWYNYWDGKVYLAFSGGKDSLVMLDIARKIFPDIPAVFCDTGLEFPEVKQFIKAFDNVTIIKPNQSFKQVISTYGYPVVSKETAKRLKYAQRYKGVDEDKYNLYVYGKMGEDGKPVYRGNSIPKKWLHLIDAPFKISPDCCLVMKKRPFYKYEKETGRKAIVGLLASEGDLRAKAWKEHGCNAFDLKHPQSQPLAIWTDSDIWQYIKRYNLKCCGVYDMGYRRTGCIFCMFGIQFDGKPNRFELLEQTHPKIHEYCMRDARYGGLGLGKVLQHIGVSDGSTQEGQTSFIL